MAAIPCTCVGGAAAVFWHCALLLLLMTPAALPATAEDKSTLVWRNKRGSPAVVTAGKYAEQVEIVADGAVGSSAKEWCGRLTAARAHDFVDGVLSQLDTSSSGAISSGARAATLAAGVNCYLCGPVSWMEMITEALASAGGSPCGPTPCVACWHIMMPFPCDVARSPPPSFVPVLRRCP